MIHWQQVPFVRLLIPLLCGILLAQHLKAFFELQIELLVSIGVLLFANGLLAFYRLNFKFRNLFSFLLFIKLLCLGIIMHLVQSPLQQRQHYFFTGERTGYFLIRIDDLKASSSGKSLRAYLSVKGFGKEPNQIISQKGKALCYFKPDAKLQTGNYYLVKAKSSKLKKKDNPGDFDYKQFLNSKRICAQLHLIKHPIKPISLKGRQPFADKISKLSLYLQKLVLQHFPPKEAGLIIALSLGQKNSLDESIKMDYSRVGAMHVLAVSGMHVGIIAFGLNYLFSLLFGKRAKIRWLKGLLAVLGIWLFAFLSGASPSVMRAALMFSLFLLAKQMLRNANIWNIIAATAFIMLCLNTRSLFMVGFQLSFLALISILYFMPLFDQLCRFKNPILKYIWQLLALGFAAQIGTAPISIFYFNQFPIFFLLSGLVIVPLATLGLLLSILFMLLHFIPFLGLLLKNALLLLVQLMNLSMSTINKIPGSVIEDLYLSPASLFLLYLILGLFILWKSLKTPLFFQLALGLICCLFYSKINFQFQQSKQAKLLVYKSSSGAALELIHGKISTAIFASPHDQKRISYGQEKLHLQKGITQSKNTLLAGTNLLIHKKGFRILFIGGSIATLDLSKIAKVDYVIIQQGAEINELKKLTPLQAKVFFINNRHPSFKDSSIGEGLNIHDLSTQGGVILPLKNK